MNVKSEKKLNIGNFLKKKTQKIVAGVMALVFMLSLMPVYATEPAETTGSIRDTFITATGVASNMKVELYSTITGGYSDEMVATTMTDENGEFLFENITPGVYNVKFDETKYTITNEGDLAEYNELGGISVIVGAGKEQEMNKSPILERLLGNIKLTKYLTGTSSYIEGATYAIYAANDLETPLDEKTTDANGEILFENLPYDNYVIKETEAAEGYFINLQSTEVTLDADEESVTVYDDAICLVRLVKTDETGETPLQGATFDLYRVGTIDAKIGTYTTDENGEIEVELTEGTYYFIETEAPEGYELNEEKHEFTLDALKQQTIELKVQNEEIKYNIYIQKIDEDTQELIAGAVLRLSKVDGDTTTLIEEWTSTTAQKQFTDLEAGTYIIEEVKAPEDYVALEEPITIVLNETETPKYDQNHSSIRYVYSVTNKKEEQPKLEILKVNENGIALEGADLQFLDEDGNILATWTSGTTAETVEVEFGKTYTIHEVNAPDGYVERADQTITIDEELKELMENNAAAGGEEWDGIYRVTFVNSKEPTYNIEVSKVNQNGMFVNGATLQLLDENGDVIDEWVSGSEAHQINNLKEGTYTIKEIKVPDGHFAANDIKITVGEDAKDEDFYNQDTEKFEYEMIDEVTEIRISKVDITTQEELEGAEIQIIDEDGNIVEEWISTKDPRYIEGLNIDEEYTLKETVAPDGYEITSNAKFRINEDGSITYSGNKTTDEDGNTILLVEDTAKKPEDKTTSIRVSKVDITTQEELEGAEIQILDKNGSIIEKWISKKEPHYIDGLEIGKEYTLHETVAPDGYKLTSDTKFTINENGTVTYNGNKTTDKNGNIILLIEDQAETVDLTVTKVDGYTGDLLAGAKLQLIDSDGKVIEEWTSEKEDHIIEDITYGKYTIREKEAPEGYIKTDDIIYEVDESNHSVTVKNYYNRVIVYKYESGTKNYVEGAILHIEDEDGNEVETWTTKDDKHTITKLEAGTYTLYEDKAPKGYKKAKPIEFEVEDGKVTKVKMYDAKIKSTSKKYDDDSSTTVITTSNETGETQAVPTGDSNTIMLYVGIGVVAILIIAFIVFRRSKKNKPENIEKKE